MYAGYTSHGSSSVWSCVISSIAFGLLPLKGLIHGAFPASIRASSVKNGDCERPLVRPGCRGCSLLQHLKGTRVFRIERKRTSVVDDR